MKNLLSAIAVSFSLIVMAAVSSPALGATSDLPGPRTGQVAPAKPRICVAAGSILGVEGSLAGVVLAVKSTGVSAVAHSSGSYILTAAAGGYVSGTLAGLTATVLGVLTMPAIMATGAILGAAAIGAGAYCVMN